MICLYYIIIIGLQRYTRTKNTRPFLNFSFRWIFLYSLIVEQQIMRKEVKAGHIWVAFNVVVHAGQLSARRAREHFWAFVSIFELWDDIRDNLRSPPSHLSLHQYHLVLSLPPAGFDQLLDLGLLHCTHSEAREPLQHRRRQAADKRTLQTGSHTWTETLMWDILVIICGFWKPLHNSLVCTSQCRGRIFCCNEAKEQLDLKTKSRLSAQKVCSSKVSVCAAFSYLLLFPFLLVEFF